MIANWKAARNRAMEALAAGDAVDPHDIAGLIAWSRHFEAACDELDQVITERDRYKQMVEDYDAFCDRLKDDPSIHGVMDAVSDDMGVPAAEPMVVDLMAALEASIAKAKNARKARGEA